MKRYLLAFVCLLTPLLMGGAHCGMTNYAGPVIDQDAIGYQSQPLYVSLVRFRRERPDYKSAELSLVTQTTASVRDCEPSSPRFPVHVYATVQGKARVTVSGTCVEVAFEKPSPTPNVQIATDIDRTFVLQSNCSPHGPPCLAAQYLAHGDGVIGEGKGKDRWTLWSIEVIPASAVDGGAN